MRGRFELRGLRAEGPGASFGAALGRAAAEARPHPTASEDRLPWHSWKPISA
jgi:hypothetical protein